MLCATRRLVGALRGATPPRLPCSAGGQCRAFSRLPAYSAKRTEAQPFSGCSTLAIHARRMCTSGPDEPKDARERRQQYDATAGKPSAVCDPYENKGQPLSESQCAQLLPDVSDEWTLAEDSTALVREIEVENFMRGAKLLTTCAAVAFNDGHFPILTLERRVGRGRRWQEVVVVKCKTAVLGGLSYRDFQLAMLLDVELERGA